MEVLVFDGLEKHQHTWYDTPLFDKATKKPVIDKRTGEQVISRRRAYPGQCVPARDIVNPQHYLNMGMASKKNVDEATEGAQLATENHDPIRDKALELGEEIRAKEERKLKSRGVSLGSR